MGLLGSWILPHTNISRKGGEIGLLSPRVLLSFHKPRRKRNSLGGRRLFSGTLHCTTLHTYTVSEETFCLSDYNKSIWVTSYLSVCGHMHVEARGHCIVTTLSFHHVGLGDRSGPAV